MTPEERTFLVRDLPAAILAIIVVASIALAILGPEALHY